VHVLLQVKGGRRGGRDGGRRVCVPCGGKDVHGEEEVEQGVALEGDEDDLERRKGGRKGGMSGCFRGKAARRYEDS